MNKIRIDHVFYGITRDAETKSYMMLSAHYNTKALEWIPYDKFHDIEYVAKGGHGRNTYLEFSASLSQQIDVSQLNINDINHKSKDEQNDDITSMEHSESLQIDISQLDTNDDKL
ncbi:unnamed protein product [Rhizophagus irregularis]|nr:unnamed protein product [Rhizophagus irregularis]CAB5376328.1 unnamed protein product [Rhizophagus irregularis]